MNAIRPINSRVFTGALAKLMLAVLPVLGLAGHAQAQQPEYVSDSDFVIIQTICSLPLNVDTTFTVTAAIDTKSEIGTAVGENGVTFHPLADDSPWALRNVVVATTSRELWVNFIGIFEVQAPVRGPLFAIHNTSRMPLEAYK